MIIEGPSLVCVSNKLCNYTWPSRKSDATSVLPFELSPRTESQIGVWLAAKFAQSHVTGYFFCFSLLSYIIWTMSYIVMVTGHSRLNLFSEFKQMQKCNYLYNIYITWWKHKIPLYTLIYKDILQKLTFLHLFVFWTRKHCGRMCTVHLPTVGDSVLAGGKV